jgi:anti-sigma B factor antagonist
MDRVVVEVEGEIDMASAPRLREALFAAIEGDACSVVADFSAVNFIDSSGLHVVIDAHNKAIEAGSKLILRSPAPNVARVIELVGLDEFLTVED